MSITITAYNVGIAGIVRCYTKMKRSIDTIIEQWKISGVVTLTQDETRRYIPNLDRKIREHNHKPHSSSSFSASQYGYIVYAHATYVNGTYIAKIYRIGRQT